MASATMFPTWSASLPKETSSAALGSAVFRPLPVMVQRAAVNYGLVARAGGGGGGGGKREKRFGFYRWRKEQKRLSFFLLLCLLPCGLSSFWFSSVQFSTVSGKPVCISTRVSEVSPVLLLIQLQCWPD